jgi:hypothetical protein
MPIRPISNCVGILETPFPCRVTVKEKVKYAKPLCIVSQAHRFILACVKTTACGAKARRSGVVSVDYTAFVKGKRKAGQNEKGEKA